MSKYVKENPLSMLLRYVRAPFMILCTMTLITGVIYPLIVTGIAQSIFPERANGSLIIKEDKVVGSELLGQEFTEKKYFWSRPSATEPPYNASASAASNISPGNPLFREQVQARIEALRKADPTNEQLVPIDLVTASASGLDPHISVEAARYQMARVAKARKLKEEEVMALIDEHTESKTFGFLGQDRINVVRLNMALDTMQAH